MLNGGDGSDLLVGDWGEDTFETGDDAGDTIRLRFAQNTHVDFKNGVAHNATLDSNVGFVQASAGVCSSSDIDSIVDALDALVVVTNNALLLEKSTGDSITFTRQGNVTNDNGWPVAGLGAWSSGMAIHFWNDTDLGGQDDVIATVFHEIAHYRDEGLEDNTNENAFIRDFRAVGGWQQFPFEIPATHESAADQNRAEWGFLNLFSALASPGNFWLSYADLSQPSIGVSVWQQGGPRVRINFIR